jgi:hypothetical protein
VCHARTEAFLRRVRPLISDSRDRGLHPLKSQLLGDNAGVNRLIHGIEGLRRLRWWLFLSVIVLLVLVRNEWAWWSAIAGPLGFAGFWVPWLAALIRDWTPSALRARAALPSERARIEKARQDLMRRRAGEDGANRSQPS